MASDYECPVCHRPLFSADEACNGSLTESDHPSGVKAVPIDLLAALKASLRRPEEPHTNE